MSFRFAFPLRSWGGTSNVCAGTTARSRGPVGGTAAEFINPADVSDTNSARPVGVLQARVLAFDELQALDGRLYWVESGKAGTSIAHWSPDEGNATHPFGTGSSAHSYGGGTFTASSGRLLAVASATGQLSDPLTGDSLTACSGHLGALASSGNSIIAVLDYGGSDRLVAIHPDSGTVEELWEAPFLASPAVTDRRIAWAQWPESAAPWNHCEIWTAELEEGNGLSAPVRRWRISLQVNG